MSQDFILKIKTTFMSIEQEIELETIIKCRPQSLHFSEQYVLYIYRYLIVKTDLNY